jgi:hypothetical protein
LINRSDLEFQLNKIVEKSSRIPTQGEVLVGVGDKVTAETVVARGYVKNPEIHQIKVYEDIFVDPKMIKKYMLKSEGEEVSENEVIARNHLFFGLLTDVSRSPIDGVIDRISIESGRAYIRGRPIRVEVKAQIPGDIVEIIPEEGAVIRTSAHYTQGKFGIGGEANGELAIIAKSPDAEIRAEEINDNLKGKIIVGGSLVTLEALQRAVEKGVSGIITGGVHFNDLEAFLGSSIGVGITGNEDVGVTVIITDGFGKVPMNEKIFQLLSSFEDKLACIFGSTQIRLRLIRPEIILPLNTA